MNKRIEIPIEAELVENENLGLKGENVELPILRASITVAHIMMITEQPDNTALITIEGGLDVVTTLTYSEIKELLK